jgi:hypothetical protein
MGLVGGLTFTPKSKRRCETGQREEVWRRRPHSGIVLYAPSERTLARQRTAAVASAPQSVAGAALRRSSAPSRRPTPATEARHF